MQMSEAAQIRQAWGDKPCAHPDFAKEYYLGSNTGEFICTQCGESFSRKEKNEIIANRNAADNESQPENDEPQAAS